VSHRDVEGPIAGEALIVTSPASVNLMALPTRLSRTWSIGVRRPGRVAVGTEGLILTPVFFPTPATPPR
jgi:hypothetical protein